MTDPKPPVTPHEARSLVNELWNGSKFVPTNKCNKLLDYIDQQEAAERELRSCLVTTGLLRQREIQDHADATLDIRDAFAAHRRKYDELADEFHALRAKLQAAERRAEEAERENARVVSCLADLPPIVKLWLSKPESGRFRMNGAHYQCGGYLGPDELADLLAYINRATSSPQAAHYPDEHDR